MKGLSFKKILFRAFFLIEIFIFGFTYLFGANGLTVLSHLKNENIRLNNENQNIKSEIKLLEDQIQQWNSDEFYREKVAREQLQMAHEKDLVYFI